MMKTPTGAVVLVEALGAVGLARAARNRCGGKQGQALFSQWGKVVVGATGGCSFIGLRVLARAEQCPKLFLQPNQRFFKSLLRFDMNLILGSFRFASVPS
jgi:hypothetical protein